MSRRPIVPGFRDKTVRKARGETRAGRGADPSQNLDVERGAVVTLGEVRAFALDGHPACRSRPGLDRDGRPCKCATRRFFKNHPEVVVDAEGNAWWPASVRKAPEPSPDPMTANLSEPILKDHYCPLDGPCPTCTL